MDVQTRVLQIIAAQTMRQPTDVRLDDTPDSLGLDSLGMVETIFGIEEAFDITVPFNANTPTDGAFDVTNVATIIAAVEHLVAARAT